MLPEPAERLLEELNNIPGRQLAWRALAHDLICMTVR
jgi:hypothetical protein